jgi:hypothetical protein
MVQVGVEAQTTAARYVAGFPPMMIEGFLTEEPSASPSTFFPYAVV